MAAPEPIYTLANCHPAYELNWSVTVFWRTAPESDEWLPNLQQATEPDGIRILRHRFDDATTSLFFVSTIPAVAPAFMLSRIKGRLQYLVRDRFPKALQRNYALRAVGDTTRARLDQYLATQLDHHPLAYPRVQQRLARFQIHQPEVDLAQERRTAHGIFWNNLHVVLVNEGRGVDVRDEHLQRHRDTILRASAKKGHLLSRAAILADHIHLTLGCSVEESPAEVALSYMNNLAYAAGMKRLFRFGFYVGTFGEYDRGAIRPGGP